MGLPCTEKDKTYQLPAFVRKIAQLSVGETSERREESRDALPHGNNSIQSEPLDIKQRKVHLIGTTNVYCTKVDIIYQL